MLFVHFRIAFHAGSSKISFITFHFLSIPGRFSQPDGYVRFFLRARLVGATPTLSVLLETPPASWRCRRDLKDHLACPGFLVCWIHPHNNAVKQETVFFPASRQALQGKFPSMTVCDLYTENIPVKFAVTNGYSD